MSTSPVVSRATRLGAVITALALAAALLVVGDSGPIAGVHAAADTDVANAGTQVDLPDDVDDVQPDSHGGTDSTSASAQAGASGREHPGQGRDRGNGPPDHAPGPPDRNGNGDDPEPRQGPTDYIAMAERGELSPERFGDDDIETVVEHVELHDGEQMYVEITRPTDEALADLGEDDILRDGLPVILKAGPYQGTLLDRRGWRIFPDPRDEEGEPVGLTGYFPKHGYAVVIADLRGTGRSSGCLDHLGPNDAKDLVTIVEHLADARWSNDRVGMTGHSYVGSTPSVAAAQAPEGLKTIVPSAGLASMYDHQFHAGVKWFLQWAGPQWTYSALTLTRELPVEVDTIALGRTGDNFPTDNPEQLGCGLTTSAYTAGHGQATGQYQAWHAQRDWREGATDADIPIFMVHGINDNAARIPAAEWFFGDRLGRQGDKVWLSQHDHGSANVTTCEDADADIGHPTCRFDQWTYALHAWFDHHLMQTGVDTGAPVELFLDDDEAWTAEVWDAPEGTLTLYPDASDMSLSDSPPEQDASESWLAYGHQFFDPSQGYVADGSSIEFSMGPLDDDLLFVGPPPRLRLDLSVTTSQLLNVVAVLERQTPDGERRPVNHCAINPHLRHGLATPAPIVPGEVMELDLQCFTIGHKVEAGDELFLSVRTWSNHHVADASTDPQLTLHTGPDASSYSLPLVPDATVHEDVEVHENGDD
jgi:uncharacterized protein